MENIISDVRLKELRESVEKHLNSKHDGLREFAQSQASAYDELIARRKTNVKPIKLAKGAMMCSVYDSFSFDADWFLCLDKEGVIKAIHEAGGTIDEETN